MGPKKLNKGHITVIRNFWLNNYKTVDIVKKLDVSRSTFYEFIKAEGINKYSIVDDDDIIALIQELQNGAKQTWGYSMINAALKRKGSMCLHLNSVAKQGYLKIDTILHSNFASK